MRALGLRRLARIVHRSIIPTKFDYRDRSVLDCSVAYNKLGAYCVPNSSRHRPAAQRILSGQVWEEETLSYITETLRDGDMVHAGTYFGDFLPALSKACGSTGVVWAFEPNQENYRCAAITLSLNDISNVNLEHAALGNANGRGFLETVDLDGRALGGGSRISIELLHRGEAVNVLTLDDLIPEKRKVSVIQLDVEGHEQEVLSGALNLIRRCRPTLILETRPQDGWLDENLSPIGYRMTTHTNRNVVLRVPASH